MKGKVCEYEKMELDEACLFLSRTNGSQRNGDYSATSLYSLSSDCIRCPYSSLSSIKRGQNVSVTLDTARSVTWRIYNETSLEYYRSVNDESGMVCQFRPELGEYGIYELTIDDELRCKFHTILEPRNSYTRNNSTSYSIISYTLAVILGSVLCLLLTVALVKACVNRWRMQRRTEGKASRRVLSIDTFRGMSILTMIFVNNGAGGYAFLEHATWNGLLVGDLVFPSFVWIMGLCIPIALSSQLARGTSRWTIVRGILKRSVALFLIDLSVNTLGSEADLKKIRIFGVLQRFAVAYAFVGILYAVLSPRKETRYPPRDGEQQEEQQQQQQQQQRQPVSVVTSAFADVRSLMSQWVFVLAITALHCALTFGLPVPGCPTGYLGPGGRHEEGRYWNCTGGATGYVDEVLLGNNHVYQRPTIDRVYGSGAFDPEGILGCLTTILQTFLGVQTGKILRVRGDWKHRVIGWLVLGLGCGLLGCLLHFTDLVPVNKNLWSLSFVLSTTSFATALFTAFYLLVDVAGVWGGGPFRIPGTNALLMYVGHRMCHEIFPFHWKYGAERPESHEWKTIAAVWDVGTWTIVAYALHRKRIYVSL